MVTSEGICLTPCIALESLVLKLKEIHRNGEVVVLGVGPVECDILARADICTELVTRNALVPNLCYLLVCSPDARTMMNFFSEKFLAFLR